MERKVPYEFLVRWDKEGRLIAAHVGFRSFVQRDDGTEIEVVDPVVPVDVGAGKGFPLSDIMSEVQASTLATNSLLSAEIAGLKAKE